MAGHPRSHVFREGEIANYHGWSRCVQRAHLCGKDEYTGRNFDYRRDWIEKLLKYQAGVFAMDLANYSVLSNHMHVIVRTRPDIVATWSDEEVACRWKMAWPEWNGHDWVREPTDEQIQELLLNPKKMALARRGLGSLSWFFARTKEPIARLANAEMSTKGHFWEQRFGAREIADDAALLTCMVYVDVNQVKARMASSLEQSRCSGIAARLAAAREREALASFEAFHKSRSKQCELSTEQLAALFADAWLAPIAANGPLMTAASLPQPDDTGSKPECPTDDAEAAGSANAAAQERASSSTESGVASTSNNSTSNPRCPETPLDAANRSIYRRLFGEGRRCRVSDSPILAMTFQDYREIVEWVAQQTSVALAAPASIPEDLVQYLHSHGADPDNWPLAVLHFHEWFGRAVGSAEWVREVTEPSGNRWIRGMRNCRATFG